MNSAQAGAAWLEELARAAPTIETDRLLLRLPTEQDQDPWTAFHADPETARFLGGALGRVGAWHSIAAAAGSWLLHGYSMFSVIEKSSGRWVGRLGPWRPAGWPGPEVGWGLAREAWGKGYATEGSAAAIDWAFDHLGWTEVIHCIDPANTASVKVAERLGSTLIRRDRMPPPVSIPVDVYGQTRAAWKSRPRP